MNLCHCVNSVLSKAALVNELLLRTADTDKPKLQLQLFSEHFDQYLLTLNINK